MNKNIMPALTTDDVILGYKNGFFPMGEEDGSIGWYEPIVHTILPLDTPLKVHRSLRQVLKKNIFEITCNKAFSKVIKGCADVRTKTWINEPIINAYTKLHNMGIAHSIEAWIKDELVGGLYGVTLGGAFFGESMFKTVDNASKVCFTALYQTLTSSGYQLCDVQELTNVSAYFGSTHITKRRYYSMLDNALASQRHFNFKFNPSELYDSCRGK